MPELLSEKKIYYISTTYLIFIFLWILLVVLNNFHKSSVSFVLLIPIIIFSIGIFNASNFDVDLQKDVFQVTFISVGLLLSLPLLKLFSEKNNNPQLNHVIFLAMISILLSYLHIWIPSEERHLCKIIQSCLETFAITLYIFALVIFFLIM